MEINKEREAFEIKFKSSDRSALDYLKYHNITNKYVISNDIDRYQMSEAQDCAHIVNVAWHMWQAAKATPEGFVLVPREPTQDMMIAALAVISTGIGKDHIDVEIIQCWKKMIEAQEQSHD